MGHLTEGTWHIQIVALALATVITHRKNYISQERRGHVFNTIALRALPTVHCHGQAACCLYFFA